MLPYKIVGPTNKTKFKPNSKNIACRIVGSYVIYSAQASQRINNLEYTVYCMENLVYRINSCCGA